jgi:hypothetical protein
MRKQTNTLSPSPKGYQSPKFSDSGFREVRGLGRPKNSGIWVGFFKQPALPGEAALQKNSSKKTLNKTENHFSHYPRSQVDINSYTRLKIAMSLIAGKA